MNWAEECKDLPLINLPKPTADDLLTPGMLSGGGSKGGKAKSGKGSKGDRKKSGGGGGGGDGRGGGPGGKVAGHDMKFWATVQRLAPF